MTHLRKRLQQAPQGRWLAQPCDQFGCQCSKAQRLPVIPELLLYLLGKVWIPCQDRVPVLLYLRPRSESGLPYRAVMPVSAQRHLGHSLAMPKLECAKMWLPA